MRILVLLLTLAFVTVYPFVAVADEYGARFYNKAPAGLGDYTAEDEEIPAIAMDEEAQRLQNIMPAAGDEESDSEQNIDAEIE